MKVDSGLFGGDLAGVPERARALEETGYDGCISAEVANDPFLPLALAAEHTERIELMTSITVAFARNPMLLANMGHDLNAFSKGTSSSASDRRSSRTSPSATACRGRIPRGGCER